MELVRAEASYVSRLQRVIDDVQIAAIALRASYGSTHTFARALGVRLPASGHEPDDAPVFEAYLNDPREVAQSACRTAIYRPRRAP